MLARLRRVDMAHGLARAGFDRVEVQVQQAWRAAERAMWEEASTLDPGRDPTLQSLHDEGVRALEMFERLQRVLATACVSGAG